MGWFGVAARCSLGGSNPSVLHKCCNELQRDVRCFVLMRVPSGLPALVPSAFLTIASVCNNTKSRSDCFLQHPCIHAFCNSNTCRFLRTFRLMLQEVGARAAPTHVARLDASPLTRTWGLVQRGWRTMVEAGKQCRKQQLLNQAAVHALRPNPGRDHAGRRGVASGHGVLLG